MTPPLTWINDRLPTEADGDEDGDVIALCDGGKAWFRSYWRAVDPGQPWIPFTPPAPQPRRFVSITRTVYGAVHTLDAVADDGTAWWMVPGEVEWTQLPALPKREDE